MYVHENLRLLKHPKNIRPDGFTELPYPPAADEPSPPRSAFQIRWLNGDYQESRVLPTGFRYS